MMTPLHFALELGRARAAQALLKAGADAGFRNCFGSRPVDKVQVNSWDAADVVSGKIDIQRLLEGGNESNEFWQGFECNVPPESPLPIRNPTQQQNSSL